jgi:hypothetical protein
MAADFAAEFSVMNHHSLFGVTLDDKTTACDRRTATFQDISLILTLLKKWSSNIPLDMGK